MVSWMAIKALFRDAPPKPCVEKISHCKESHEYYSWDGSGWVTTAMVELVPMDLYPDEYLEEQHEELREARKEYNKVRDKVKTFEIIKDSA